MRPRIKIEAKCRGQHGRGEILRLFTTLLSGHAVPVLLRYIYIQVRIRRRSQTEAGVYVAPEFIGLRPGQHAEGDISRPEQLDPSSRVII
jgi:hypothetical protein